MSPSIFMIAYLVYKLVHNCFFHNPEQQYEEEEEEEGLLNGSEGHFNIQAAEPCPLERAEFHRSYHRHYSNAAPSLAKFESAANLVPHDQQQRKKHFFCSC